MSRRATIQDVAREAGTSVSTVSRVLTGSAPVTPDRRQTVEEAIQRLDFRPSHVARSLRTRATLTVSLLINDITNPFYSAIAKGVEQEAKAEGYSLILCNTDEDPEIELRYLWMMLDKQVDGIILGPTGANEEVAAQLARRMPMVMVDRRLEDVPAAAVVADNVGGAYRAVRMLIGRGHERIGLLTWRLSASTLAERQAGYARALREAGLPFEPNLIREVARPVPSEARRAVTEWLHGEARPTALFALNNQLGLGALAGIRDSGLNIPRDVALVVFDDLDLFELTVPTITAVAQPAHLMGRRAMQFLKQRIENPDLHLPEVAILPTELVLRDST
jgi:LacI family transcriptional regulator